MRSRHRQITVALFFGAITLMISPISAQTTTWTDATGSWETTGNWDNGVPNSTTDAHINNGGTAQIGSSGDTANNIVLGLNAVDSGTLSSSATSLTASGDITVGDVGTGTMQISLAGSIGSVNGIIGNAAGSHGTVTVDGGLAIFSSEWTMSGDLSVGNGGTGTLSITNGGEVTVNGSFARIGEQANSTGTVTVDGADSTWTLANELDVARAGTGTLTITNGGVVNMTGSGRASIGVLAGSNGTASVDGLGSMLTNSAGLIVGEGGTGTLTITSGGVVSNTIGYIGYNAGSNGAVTIGSSVSSWTNSGALYVGYGGTGTLDIKSGAKVSDTDGDIGFSAGSNGRVTVDNDLSTWTNSGELTVGDSGTGTLNITHGGTVSSVDLYIGNGPAGTGTVTVDGTGSTLTVSSSLYLGNGTLGITHGGVVSSDSGDIAYSGDSTGSVTVDGAPSKWAISGDLDVGGKGMGTLNIRNGGAVSDTDGDVGVHVSPDRGVGIVNVDGTSSTWTNSGTLTIGDSGDGTLHITTGGVVSNTNGFIANQSDSTGTVTVDGAGSTWTNSTGLQIGVAGTGTLTITNGGVVNNGGNALLGGTATGNGMATVDGTGSKWTSSTDIYVGDLGTGSLTISHGGQVRDIGGTLGANANVTGTAKVDGTGSTWTNFGSVQVGDLGNGTLNILNGGTVTAVDAFIAEEDGSTGLAVVNGAGGASTVQLSGNFFVGGDDTGPHGTGVLRVLNGGIVNSNRLIVLSTGTLEIGVNPAITVTNPFGIEYNGGTLKTIADTTLTNNGSLQTGGVIFDSNGFTSTLSGVYSGSGGVSKIGAGAIVLTNTNTYGGDTVINAGSLIVDGSIASSSTTVNPNGLLGGVGTIGGNVINGGIVSPGDSPGTLTINGNYSQNSVGTLRIEVAALAAGQHDLLSVGGSATLDGTLQVLRLNNFTPMSGDRVTIINDAGGHSGTFSAVTGTFSGVLRPVPMYNEANDVYILFQLGSFNIGGLTPNQKSVAHNLDSAANDPAAANLITFLEMEPAGTLPHDYDLIAPEELASIYEIGFSQAVVQNDNLQRRMDDIRAGSNGFCANGFTPQVSGKDYTKDSDGKVSLPDKSTRDVYTPTPDNRWGVFVTGTGDFVNVGNDDSNAPGYDITTGDVTVGADYRLCDHFAIGIDAGYSRSTADLVDDGRVDVDGGKVGAYATVFGKGLFGSKFYVDGAVGGGFNSYDTRRTGLQDEPVRGSTDGSEFNAMISYGSDWTFGCFNIGTWSSVQFTNVSIDQFTETGSLAPLIIQDQDENSFRTTTGLHASYDIKAGHFLFRPEIRAAYQHEYCDSAYQVDSQLASGAGTVFRVRGPNIGRDAALVGTGMNMQWNNRLSTYVYYDGVLGRNNYDNNAVSGGFRIGF